MPDGAWEYLYDSFRVTFAGKEWPEEVATLHLRWLLGERWTGRMKAKDFPTVRELAEVWGWKRDRVADLVGAPDRWQEAGRRMSVSELRGERKMGANARRNATRRGQDGDKTGTSETDERRESESNRDKVATSERQASDAVRDNSARVHPSPSTSELSRVEPPPATPPPRESEPSPPEPPTPHPEAPLPAAAAWAALRATPAEPARTCPPCRHPSLADDGRCATCDAPYEAVALDHAAESDIAADFRRPDGAPHVVEAVVVLPGGRIAAPRRHREPEPEPPEVRATDGRPVPRDFPALGLSDRDADRLVRVAGIDTPAELLALTEDQLRWREGIGDTRAPRIAKACRLAGFPLGCVRPDATPAATEGGRAWSSLEALEAAGHHEQDPPEALDADPARDRRMRLALSAVGGWRSFARRKRDPRIEPAMRADFLRAYDTPAMEAAK